MATSGRSEKGGWGTVHVPRRETGLHHRKTLEKKKDIRRNHGDESLSHVNQQRRQNRLRFMVLLRTVIQEGVKGHPQKARRSYHALLLGSLAMQELER